MAEQTKPKQPDQSQQHSQSLQASQREGEEQQQDDSFDPEKAYERGYFGNRPDVFDDEEFALTSGPHSPGQRDLEDPDSYDSSKSVTDE